jgi:hypothetical protein
MSHFAHSQLPRRHPDDQEEDHPVLTAVREGESQNEVGYLWHQVMLQKVFVNTASEEARDEGSI